VRWGEGRRERFAEIAAEFVRLKVDVIVTGGSAMSVIKAATFGTPLVFALASDPIAAGYVASLARPGGNITGLTLNAPDLAGKRLEILREIVRGLHTLAVLANVSNPGNILELSEVHASARKLGVDVVRFEVRRAEDISPAVQAQKGRVDALYICADPLFGHNIRLITLTLVAGLPTMHNERESVAAGGLVFYGASIPAMFRRAADFVDKILRGTSPADIPVEQPTKFDFAINLTTAQALGLKVPLSLLATADEVIE
jgi:putative ABC transport system substrate-binding protein